MLFRLACLIPLLTGGPTDTLRLRPADAVDRAIQQSRLLAAADARLRASAAGVASARAWRNPSLGLLAENLGATRDVTGRSGLAGIEGQVTLTGWLPLGGDHGAQVGQARALDDAARAERALTEQSVRAGVLAVIAVVERDQALTRHAREEAEALERFAAQMAQRAEEGRSAGGEAARARLEADLAGSRAARYAATAVGSLAELRRMLGVPPDTVVVIESASCGIEPIAPGPVPELDLARARQRAAEAAAAVIHARGIPDLWPQVGLRRSAGFSGLLVGFAIDLPLASTGRDATAAARAEAEAVRAEGEELGRRLTAERAGAEQALAGLDAAGGRFGAEWRADLDRALSAALARYTAGEGTLTELLDARRARLAVLDEYETWRAERRLARLRLARLSGAAAQAAFLCDDASRSDS